MKKKNKIIAVFFLILYGNINAQVGIGTSNPAPSSILDVSAVDKGILIPRMNSEVRDGITTPAPGLLIYNTTDLGFNYYQSGWKDFSPAYYEVNSTSPINISSLSDTAMPGLSFSPKAGNYLAQFNAQYTFYSSITVLAVEALNASIITLMNLGTDKSSLPAYTIPITHPSSSLLNETLLSGVYDLTGPGTADGIITLDAQGDSTKLFVIKIGSSFNLGAGTEIRLAGDAKASNVFWIAGAAVGLGASTKMKGTIISMGAALSIGASCSIEGSIFTTAGAISLNQNTLVKTPLGVIDLGILNSFAIFTSAGDIANTSVSHITGDIGTNYGAITTFGNITGNANGTVVGTLYFPGSQIATATFSIFQNGVQIPNSVRIRKSDVDTVDIRLQTIAAVEAGKDIEVRCKLNSGVIQLKNRNFLIVNIK